MKLYIVRHAIAIPHGAPGVQDDDRTLTEGGAKKMRKAAAGLCRLEYVPDLLLSSPLIRATQTADILLQAFGKKVQLKIAPSLAPSGRRQDLYREIARHSKELSSLMLVGHQPSLGEMVGEIAWGSSEHGVDLKKGGACALEVDIVQGVPKGRLVALLTPSILRQAGRPRKIRN